MGGLAIHTYAYSQRSQPHANFLIEQILFKLNFLTCAEFQNYVYMQ